MPQPDDRLSRVDALFDYCLGLALNPTASKEIRAESRAAAAEWAFIASALRAQEQTNRDEGETG